MPRDLEQQLAELHEIADGAFGDNPMVRGRARDEIQRLEDQNTSWSVYIVPGRTPGAAQHVYEVEPVTVSLSMVSDGAKRMIDPSANWVTYANVVRSVIEVATMQYALEQQRLQLHDSAGASSSDWRQIADHLGVVAVNRNGNNQRFIVEGINPNDDASWDHEVFGIDARDVKFQAAWLAAEQSGSDPTMIGNLDDFFAALTSQEILTLRSEPVSLPEALQTLSDLYSAIATGESLNEAMIVAKSKLELSGYADVPDVEPNLPSFG